MDQTRTDQSEQDGTEINDNKPAWSRAASTKPMQTKANRPDLGKAEQSKQDHACPGISGRPNQDSTDTNRRTQTKTTRQTRPGPINQHRRSRPYETIPGKPNRTEQTRPQVSKLDRSQQTKPKLSPCLHTCRQSFHNENSKHR